MTASLDKKSPLEQTLDGLVRRGWITKAIAQSILSADDSDKPKVLTGHVNAGRVTAAVGRTILNRAQTEAKKHETYDTVIDRHVGRVPASKD